MTGEYLLPTRAEEIGNRVFDYFAMPSQSFYSRMLKNKAAVLIGGRGTGKTMLLKSMAFEYKSNSLPRSEEIWRNEHYLGCYIRIDTHIVSNFRGRGISEEVWGELYAHYFNFRATQQIVNTIKKIITLRLVFEDKFLDFINRYFELIDEPSSERSIESMEKSIRRKIDELVRYINNPNRVPCPILTNNGEMIFSTCSVLQERQEFRDKTWYILLDEYENLSENQQRIINTLVKANQPPVIFKLAMRPSGWRTQQTLALSESLESIADYDLIDYQVDFSDEDYETLVIEAFTKSLALNKISDMKYLDVRELLPEQSPEEEALSIKMRSKRTPKYIERMKKIISCSSKDPNEQLILENKLILIDEPLRTRIHLVLLDRGTTPQIIARELDNNSSKYQEWYKHNRIGTLFLFCSEYQTKKSFTGFDTYILLSSKIMRNFVSLFSRAWELSLDEGFNVDRPLGFSFDTQTKAACDISQKKVFEISSYASIGPALYSFANQLGRIFERLNRDEKQSQPERNHFGVNGEMSDIGENLLRGALLNSVIQETAATKMKSGTTARGKDYLLNRIYCPFYNMSYRKMHKLELDAADFEVLLTGLDEEKRGVAQKLFKKYLKDQNVESENHQLNLLDPFL